MFVLNTQRHPAQSHKGGIKKLVIEMVQEGGLNPDRQLVVVVFFLNL